MLEARDVNTGEVVPTGTTVTTFRGESVTLVRLDRAEGPGHSGKITVQFEDGGFGYYYDNVCDLVVREKS